MIKDTLFPPSGPAEMARIAKKAVGIWGAEVGLWDYESRPIADSLKEVVARAGRDELSELNCNVIALRSYWGRVAGSFDDAALSAITPSTSKARLVSE